jgi:hypothetical protein
MASQKRAPSIDMTSIELEDVPSPAPTYSSTFHSQNVPITPQHAYSAATPKSGVSNHPCHQSPAHEPPSYMPQSKGKTLSKDEEDVQVKPDYQDPNHPHFAGSTSPNLPPTLPARSRIPRKRILIPWILAVIFFLISLWFTSILVGARFFSIIHPLPSTPPAREINVYINGQVFQGTVSVSTATVTIPTSTIISTAPVPSTTEFPPGSHGDVPPDTGNDLGAISKLPKRRLAPAPTGFVTITTRIR